jgi:ABC-type phosphate/phosphonate transport system substrate-binding protein
MKSMDRSRRQVWRAIGAAAALCAAPVWSQGSAKPGAARNWRFVINEAVTDETNFFVLTSRYRPLADYVSDRMKWRLTIGVEPVMDIKRFLSLAQAQPRPELVFGKSVNQLAKLVRDEGYQPLVRRADPYKAAFIVARDSPIKTLPDVGKTHAKIIMPDEFAATSAVARAELRRHNVAAPVVHIRYQEAVAQQIRTGFGQVGVVNPIAARKWAEEGGRILAETQPVVNWSLLASPTLAGDAVQQVRDALLSMNTQAAPVLAGLGVNEWARAEKQDYLALLDYTKE